jgi:hypothetical protein
MARNIYAAPLSNSIDEMRALLASGFLLFAIGLGVLFAWFAVALRRDLNTRFAAIRERLERDANAMVRHIINRDSP